MAETGLLQAQGNGVWRAPGACIVDRTGRKRLPIGFGDFASVAPVSVFVDKTQLIADVLDSGYSVTLFCRPRRFGKTLNMTMMRSFFEIPPDGVSRAEWFEGTDVWQAGDGRYRQHQGAYPVINLSMLTAKRLTWDQTYGSLVNMIADEYRRHDYLLRDETMPDKDRAYFERILSRRAFDELKPDYLVSLQQLVVFLNRYHQRPVVLLLDEYDAPIMAAYSSPKGSYYNEAVDFVKTWLTGTLKNAGDLLALACLTGVQRISKESIFSDLNNLVVNTALSTEFDERYGFTEAEVEALASYLGLRDCMDDARTWYDGYRFGNQDVYNPWSVLNFLKQDCVPDVYWGNTSSNSVVGDLLHSADTETLGKIYDLLKPGGVVAAPLDLSVVFPDLGINKNAIWSMLYLAGYLTTEDTGLPGNIRVLRRLRIPDAEIAELYRSEIVERFALQAGGNDRLQILHTALVEGNAEVVERELNRILRDSTSSFDVLSENALHMLMTGLCFGVSGYDDPQSNKESGYGRYDLRLEPARRGSINALFVVPPVRPLITIELKFVSAADLPHDEQSAREMLLGKAKEALVQIDEKGYDAGPLPEHAQGRMRWGIAVANRRCAARCERL